MYLAIDGIPLIRKPHTIEVVPQQHNQAYTADQRALVQPGGEYVVVNATFGRALTYEMVMAELNRRRASRGVHSITFEPMRGGRRLTINAYMGVVREAHVGYDSCGRIISSNITVPFVQVDTVTSLYPIRWKLRGILSVFDAWTYQTALAGGTIIAVNGWIRDLGSGAGQTRIQISNATTDYLSTRGDFVQGGTHVLINQVVAANADFAGGDRLDIDIDGIPAGGLSQDALITAWCWLFRP